MSENDGMVRLIDLPGLAQAQLLDEIDHALIDKPRSQWSPDLEVFYQKALDDMGIIDAIDACGAPCDKDECVHEAPLRLVMKRLSQ